MERITKKQQGWLTLVGTIFLEVHDDVVAEQNLLRILQQCNEAEQQLDHKRMKHRTLSITEQNDINNEQLIKISVTILHVNNCFYATSK